MSVRCRGLFVNPPFRTLFPFGTGRKGLRDITATGIDCFLLRIGERLLPIGERLLQAREPLLHTGKRLLRVRKPLLPTGERSLLDGIPFLPVGG